MTRKELILRMVERQPEDVTYDQVMYHLGVMRDIEIGMEQIERGEGIDHDTLFEELLAEDAQGPDPMVPARETESAKHPEVHRAKRTADGDDVRKAPKKRGGKTKKL